MKVVNTARFGILARIDNHALRTNATTSNDAKQLMPSVRIHPMNYADDEKLRLLRWLVPNLTQNEIVAAELPYRDVGRKADLAILSPTRLAAIEIKGPRDKLSSLAAQVQDYLEAFLEVDVAVSTRYLASVRNTLPPTVGLIELGDGVITRRRRAAVRSRLSAAGSLHWLRAKDLQRLIPDPAARKWDISTLRQYASEHLKITALSRAAVEAAWQRSQERFAAFELERAGRLTLDDVALLQGPTRIR